MTKKKKRKSTSVAQRHDRRRHESPTSAIPSTIPSTHPPHGKGKKRKRSRSKTGDVRSDGVEGAADASSIATHAVHWLEKRKKKVPDALRAVAGPGAGVADVAGVLALLPGLRERERRALARHVEKCIAGGDDGGDAKAEEMEGSDGEYDLGDASGGREGLPDDWPSDVEFSNDYCWDPAVPDDVRRRCSPSDDRVRKRAPRRSRRVYFKRIVDPDHPACGEFGLYCALDRAPPGTWLLDYVGRVSRGEDQDKGSDYVSDFGEGGELACDAKSYGNEARFLNDFRNTGKHPNVEFNKRRDANGELRQGVFVKLAKDAKEEGFDGVRRGEELLVSYGKSYWRSRVGNLTDFVWRIPGGPMPEGGRPTR